MTEDHFRCSKRLVSKRNLTRFTALIFCRSSHSCKVDKYITETVTFNVQRPKTQRVIKPDVYFFFFFADTAELFIVIVGVHGVVF